MKAPETTVTEDEKYYYIRIVDSMILPTWKISDMSTTKTGASPKLKQISKVIHVPGIRRHDQFCVEITPLGWSCAQNFDTCSYGPSAPLF